MRLFTTFALAGLIAAESQPAAAQEPTAAPTPVTEACVTVDTARDMLSPDDRSAAVIFVSREFERAGARLVPAPCARLYSLSHARLGRVISVMLSGPLGRRESVARGLDDLPAVYSQMVRSLVTGRTMEGLNVTDRTNVTDTQAATPKRVQVESFGYSRLGYAGVFGNGGHGAPAMGFGYRAELEKFAVDVSFFNSQISQPSGSYSSYGDTNRSTTASILKLEGLHFFDAKGNTSAYLGGGFSLGLQDSTAGGTHVHGSGLQIELTGGYEFARSSSLRLFVQADATLPLFRASVESYAYSSKAPYTTYTNEGSRYMPSISISVGIGWQRGNHR
jgi:hypothetical protein